MLTFSVNHNLHGHSCDWTRRDRSNLPFLPKPDFPLRPECFHLLQTTTPFPFKSVNALLCFDRGELSHTNEKQKQNLNCCADKVISLKTDPGLLSLT